MAKTKAERARIRASKPPKKAPKSRLERNRKRRERKKQLQYCIATLPVNLCLKKSSFRARRYEVWSLEDIPAGIRFGPFHGIFDDVINHSRKRAFQYKAERNGKKIMIPYSGDKEETCWIQNINFTCSKEEQNVIAVHRKSEIYYITCKHISANQELLVWCHFYHIEKTKGRYIYARANTKETELVKLDSNGRYKNTEILSKAIGECCQKVLKKESTTKKIHSERNDSPPTKNQRHVASDSMKSGHSVIHTIRTPFNKQRSIKNENGRSGGNNKYEMNLSELNETSEIRNEAHLDESNISKDTLLHFREITCSEKQHHYNYDSINNEREMIDLHQLSHSYSTTGKSSSSIQTTRQSYICRFCGKEFTAKNELILHAKVHTRKTSYACNICGKKFTTNSHLNVHKRIHTGDRPYQCSICGKKFNTNSHLNVHQRIHTGDKPFQCNICGKKFLRNSELNVHKRIHTGDRPYPCSICGLKFITCNKLNLHKKTHTGDRPYQCSNCGKKFNTNSHLNVHKRTHTGDRPYQCSICGLKFNTNSNLNVHKRIHTGDRPYQCSICGKKFITGSKLNVHQRTHADDKPFQRDICGKKFKRNTDLHVHK